jgi:hypothetical protein
MAKKGDWVLISRIILEPSERAPQVPDDTKKTPLTMWIRGFLQEDAQIGDDVTVLTRTKRKETGRLLEVNPQYHHDFGNFVPELLTISEQVREIVFGGDES